MAGSVVRLCRSVCLGLFGWFRYVCLCPSRSARVSGCVAGSVILYFVCLYLSVSVCLGLWLCGWFCYFVCLRLSLSAWVSVAVWLVPLFCLYLSAWVSGLMAGCLSAQKLQGLWYVSSRVSVCVCVCVRARVSVCVCVSGCVRGCCRVTQNKGSVCWVLFLIVV